jgi:hypothetical protein
LHSEKGTTPEEEEEQDQEERERVRESEREEYERERGDLERAVRGTCSVLDDEGVAVDDCNRLGTASVADDDPPPPPEEADAAIAGGAGLGVRDEDADLRPPVCVRACV